MAVHAHVPARWGTLLPRRVLVLALLLTIVLVGTVPRGADAASQDVNAERDFSALVNVERAKKGLGSLVVRSDIVTTARRHSDAMASRGTLDHNPDFTTQISGWQRLSENVGVGPSVAAIHEALMESPGHRRNILDAEVTEIGIGVSLAGGRVWVTQNFRRPSSHVAVAPASLTTFGDVATTNVHAASITTVATEGIVDACGTARFCPEASVSRGAFATMLVRALQLPATSARTFDDTAGPNTADIEALAAAGLTAGCGEGRFCPEARLTREQLATFFARALAAEPTPSPFRDVTSVHDGSVGALHARGIVSGCTVTTFCPRTQVTRAQTASMIARNLA